MRHQQESFRESPEPVRPFDELYPNVQASASGSGSEGGSGLNGKGDEEKRKFDKMKLSAGNLWKYGSSNRLGG